MKIVVNSLKFHTKKRGNQLIKKKVFLFSINFKDLFIYNFHKISTKLLLEQKG